jgi:CheY-like chemotaxis protein
MGSTGVLAPPLLRQGRVAELLREARYEEALARLYEARDARPADAEIADAIRVVRDQSYRAALDRLGNLEAAPRRVRDAIGLAGDEKYLFDLVAAGQTVDELLDVSTLGRHRTVHGLVWLLDRGYLELDTGVQRGSAVPSVSVAKNVVVADGSSSQAALTRTMLRIVLGGGASLVTATTSAELVAAAEKQRPDLVVVEFTLPGSDGLAALRAARKASGGPIPSVVVVQRVELDFVGGRLPERSVVLARPIEKATLVEALATLGFASVRARTKEGR